MLDQADLIVPDGTGLVRVAQCKGASLHSRAAGTDLMKAFSSHSPNVLWVRLGLPKQERWIYEHRHRLNVPLVLELGAAFKFLAGTVKRAPDCVGNLGFE